MGEGTCHLTAVKIDVYDDFCQGGKAAGPVEFDITDVNQDSITNLTEFAVMAAAWLDNYALTAPVVR